MAQDGALEMMVEYLGVDPGEAMDELVKTMGAHARFIYLKNVYENVFLSALQADGDDEQVALHRSHVLRAYLLYLVGTSIFVDKSVTYTDVVYLCYFVDFERIHEYKFDLSCLPVFEAERGLYVKDEAGRRQRDTTDGNNYWSLNVSLSFSFHLCKSIIDDLCVPNISCQGWILQHFSCISGWASVHDYTEDMLRATAFIPLRGNQAIEPYRLYLDCLVVKDMHFNSYVNHRETLSFDEMILHSGWLSCGSRLIAPHMPEHDIRQFEYTHTIPRHPVVSAPPALTCI
ncbi:uncharacterized protein LOC127102595 [Lathyrus oleraceus]|uniref:uncharacterized protein LOC127102595 n=1 Tax=Pisum sativum TaxID=3888 RepID=UPI0021D3BC0E|nr:uncharacterized protein LOC127102595 [Pisum sativum]